MEFERRPGAIASSLVAPLAVFVVSFGSERGSLGADAIANSNMRSSVAVQRRAPSTRHSVTPLSILVMSYGDERGGLSADVITIDIKMGSMEFSAARRSLCLELPCQRLCCLCTRTPAPALETCLPMRHVARGNAMRLSRCRCNLELHTPAIAFRLREIGAPRKRWAGR